MQPKSNNQRNLLKIFDINFLLTWPSWKTNVDEISVKLSCSGNYDSGQETVILEWQIGLSSDEVKRLFETETVTRDVEVKISRAGGSTLWPHDKNGIRIIRPQYGSSLSVKFSHLKSDLLSQPSQPLMALETQNYVETTFVCPWAELGRVDGEKTIYRGGYLRGSDRLLLAESGSKLKLNVLIDPQCKLNPVEGTAECNLKVLRFSS